MSSHKGYGLNQQVPYEGEHTSSSLFWSLPDCLSAPARTINNGDQRPEERPGLHLPLKVSRGPLPTTPRKEAGRQGDNKLHLTPCSHGEVQSLHSTQLQSRPSQTVTGTAIQYLNPSPSERMPGNALPSLDPQLLPVG